AIAGEWGHNPMPWPRPEWDEVPGPKGWDGRYGSIEAYCSGPGIAEDHARVTGEKKTSEEVVSAADAGDEKANATLARMEDRLARALSTIINVIDPDVIVAGGGVSRIARIYKNVPALWDQWVFSDRVDTKFVPAIHGDSSGVGDRGGEGLANRRSRRFPAPDVRRCRQSRSDRRRIHRVARSAPARPQLHSRRHDAVVGAAACACARDRARVRG